MSLLGMHELFVLLLLCFIHMYFKMKNNYSI